MRTGWGMPLTSKGGKVNCAPVKDVAVPDAGRSGGAGAAAGCGRGATDSVLPDTAAGALVAESAGAALGAGSHPTSAISAASKPPVKQR
jgi:hypothetical protein